VAGNGIFSHRGQFPIGEYPNLLSVAHFVSPFTNTILCSCSVDNCKFYIAFRLHQLEHPFYSY
jgi:hypothetical protein